MIEMKYRRLGRTGLRVSLLSLGSGGPNRFGQSRYVRPEKICRLVQQALDYGINFFDTAAAYQGSESLLGRALSGAGREQYLVASKILPFQKGEVIGASTARRQVEKSLRALGVDALDLLQLHRVLPDQLDRTLDCLAPELEKLRDSGKVRFLGITEASSRDPRHRMLSRALQCDFFDTVMVAYSLANDSAEHEILPLAQAKDVGVIGMTPARLLLAPAWGERFGLAGRTLLAFAAHPANWSRPRLHLSAAGSVLTGSRRIRSEVQSRQDSNETLSLPSAGYTFAASHPAVSTVLTGTASEGHLRENLSATLAPAMTPREKRLLQDLLDN